MKHIFLIVAISLFWINLFSQNRPDPNFLEKLSKHKIEHFNRIRKVETNVGQNYDINYHRLEWEIDPTILYIKGVVSTYFKITENLVSEISFDIDTSLNVDSVVFNGSLMNFTHTDGVLSISLSNILDENHLDSVSVYYQGVPGNSGFGSFSQSWHDGSPIVSTLSEPYGAKDWWPCKQNLTDKIDSCDIFVKSDAQYDVASNGILVSEIIEGNNKTTHWKHKYPIAAYLIAIAVTDYSIYSEYAQLNNGDSLEVLNYVYPENFADAQLETPNTVEFIELFNELFIEYPFVEEKYGHAQFSWGGGMEHQTMSFMGNFGWQLQAHELAHQWFGDYITCGSWEDIWLNEGFATYLTGLAYLYLNPSWWDLWKQIEIGKIISQPGGSVQVDDTSSVSRIFDSRLSYAKGAMVLHMLRWELGDSAFYKGVRDYLQDPMLLFNYAKTPDLIDHLEFSADTNLSDFFADWYYGEGYPTYSIEWEQDEMNKVLLTVSQTQSHESVDFFEMHLPIQFFGENQDSTVVFHHLHDNKLFGANLNFAIDSIVFDPERWIITGECSIINSINEKEFPTFSIYPNPASDKIFIGNVFKGSKTEISIYSNNGKKLFSNSLKSLYRFLELDVSDLSSGIYFVEIKTNNTSLTEKLIIY
ncbi:MAG: T9SS type A sorting domain-containing protein [Bacteroidetes bacterium]|nr:T9SS type A sorting domain-containing protein [Bacteroidota bacterium]